MKEIIVAMALLCIIIGGIGKVSALDESPNTATLVALTGFILLGMYLI